ncbi:MAG TPA: S8 family serine peptidase, partial [Blastocatellia bacterium]|nr:S8 family serine peptidase [Blastocatellia bacterium]
MRLRSSSGADSPQPKIAADLWAQVSESLVASRGDELVRVIVQTADNNGGDLRYVRLHSGRSLDNYPDFNLRVVELPASAVEKLAAQPNVRSLSPDRAVRGSDNSYNSHIRRASGVSAALASSGLSGLSGTGVGIAILDSGVQADHNDIITGKTSSNSLVSVSFVPGDSSTGDRYGHGTHVASLAAGTGYGLSGYDGQYSGIAPDARIINVRVLGADGSGNSSDVIAGINWCIANKAKYNIRVMNLSLGGLTPESYKTDPLCQAAERAVNAGIVVVAAAGNSGKDANGTIVYGGIHSPGIDPMVITVGAANTYGTDARSDDTVATYSSRGPTYTDRLMKPDLVAPGNKIMGAEAARNALVTAHPQLDFAGLSDSKKDLMTLNGTSMAAPIV